MLAKQHSLPLAQVNQRILIRNSILSQVALNRVDCIS